MYTPPSDLVPFRTADGSFTLRSEALGEQYHSVHGAVQESRHVFLAMGLDAIAGSSVNLLEVGLGTGLNALLTWIAADGQHRGVHYTALEPYPLSREVLATMDHSAACDDPAKSEAVLDMLTVGESEWQRMSAHFSFRRSGTSVLALEDEAAYDLVYFDAFGPDTQPELWTEEAFHRVHRAMRPGALLVTYCAKGAVRRAMQAAGLRVERLPGPPGKREMLRARKP